MASINFDELIQRLADAPVRTEEDLSIWGGDFEAARLADFLKGWKLEQREIPWRVWEQVSQIVFRWETLPGNPELLERGRLFGPGGDLSLRRDGNRFLWHFIGPAEVEPPAGFEARNYWEDKERYPLREHDETVLLWGEWYSDPGRWLEDRAGRADLQYPKMLGEERVWLDYGRYEEAGQTAFIWYRGLRGLEAYNG
jgi:hypothetical protein